MNIVENYLQSFKLIELKNKIRNFRKLQRNQLSDTELRDELYKVLTVNSHFSYEPKFRKYSEGNYFYRVRKLTTSFLGEELKSKTDFWSPPPNLITKYQRLNKPNESLLYTALDIDTAIAETKIGKGDFFTLIIYENVAELKAVCIGTAINESNTEDSLDELKRIEIDDFFAEEFSKSVGTGLEYYYKTSELIAKDFFDLPPRLVQDAWEYPSIHNRNRFNICLRPNIAEEILVYKTSMICKMQDNGFSPVAIQYDFNIKDEPFFYEFDDIFFKSLVPKFPLVFEKSPL